MFGWIEPFVERADPAIEPGQIWCAQPILLPPSHGLQIAKVDPKDDRKVDFKLTGSIDEAFDQVPVFSLGLRSGEAIVLARATRRRPVVVLGATTATQRLPDDVPCPAETVMVVPLYAAGGHDERTRRRVCNYEFANAFYVPASERPRLEESIARLDHTQPVARADLAEPRGVKLSADALDALVEWFVAFTTNRLLDDSLILEYRRQQLAGGA